MKMKPKRLLCYFTPFEWALWLLSALAITLSFLLFDRESLLTLAAFLGGDLYGFFSWLGMQKAQENREKPCFLEKSVL